MTTALESSWSFDTNVGVSGMGYGVYIFFATMLIGASVYAWFFIHETKGLRIDQMDELFGFVRPGNAYASKEMDAESDNGIVGKSSAVRIEVV